MKRLALAIFTAVAAAGAIPLTSVAAPVGVYIGVAPPAPRLERMPPPRHGYVWAPGHWAWNGHRHDWVGGYWIAERPGYAYTAPVWVQRGGGWYLEPERWVPYGGYGPRVVEAPRYVGPGYDHPRYDGPRAYGDRNRDGIPDRYEHGRRHDEDHDGVPNRYDRDRDGDGVPNHHDERPDNPYRR
jgi:hypothetical protein